MNCFTKTIFLIVTIVYSVIGAPLDPYEEPVITDATTTPNCPRIVTRDEWHARNSKGEYTPMTLSPAPYVVAHHGGFPHYCHDQETCTKIVKGYQDFHMDFHHWIDIGYHFVIGGDGNVYEGRGWNNVGAHAPGYNTQGIGISIIGDYTTHMPNNASLEAFGSLIECGISLGKITPDYKLIGHRQGRVTECPGEMFYRFLKTLPHWESNPVPLWGTSTIAKKTKPVKAVTVATPTIDITGSKLWVDLTALGEPEMRESSDVKVEENVVDTGNATVKTSIN